MSKEVEKYYVKRGEEVIDSLFDKGYFRDDVTRKELKALQEIMLGMLPEESHTCVTHKHLPCAGCTVQLIEQNIRGGFKV